MHQTEDRCTGHEIKRSDTWGVFPPEVMRALSVGHTLLLIKLPSSFLSPDLSPSERWLYQTNGALPSTSLHHETVGPLWSFTLSDFQADSRICKDMFGGNQTIALLFGVTEYCWLEKVWKHLIQHRLTAEATGREIQFYLLIPHSVSDSWQFVNLVFVLPTDYMHWCVEISYHTPNKES